ncbi:MAG: hypothetical protein IJY74_05820 [Oscillospiraceae bacterium]|nr:hypothetical protein [Oscillospiraceae bacterium]
MKRMKLKLWLNQSQRHTLEMIFYMILLTAGCTWGTVCILTDRMDSLCSFCTAYGIPSSDSGVFLSSVRWWSSLWTLFLCLGLCGIGQPFLCVLLIIHGFSIGCMLTRLYEGSGITHILAFIPEIFYAIAVSLILLFAAREAMRLACSSVKMYLLDSGCLERRSRLRLYFIRFAVLLIMLLAVSGLYTMTVSLCKI